MNCWGWLLHVYSNPRLALHFASKFGSGHHFFNLNTIEPYEVNFRSTHLVDNLKTDHIAAYGFNPVYWNAEYRSWSWPS